MKKNFTISASFIRKNLALLLLIGVSAIGAYATLGDGKAKKAKPAPKPLLSNKIQTNSFSLRSGFQFRGAEVINTQSTKYININTVLTYQRGNTSYVVPLKKKVLLNNVKIEIGNRQLRRN